jgi:hypothetical protein
MLFIAASRRARGLSCGVDAGDGVSREEFEHFDCVDSSFIAGIEYAKGFDFERSDDKVSLKKHDREGLCCGPAAAWIGELLEGQTVELYRRLDMKSGIWADTGAGA